MVEETSNTWLNSLKEGDPRAAGWMRLVEAYGPFIQGILLSRGVVREVAEDIVQNVMTVVARRLPDFERERTGSFRALAADNHRQLPQRLSQNQTERATPLAGL